MSNAKCSNCQWWFPVKDDEDEPLEFGKCYRFPPTPFKSEKGNTFKEVAVSCTFPVTTSDSFCGEFKS
jgi:hypothetical protein